MRFRRIALRLLIGAIAGSSAAPLLAKCEVKEYFQLPVTMVGPRPIVTVQINGRDARFILDSGAFFSTISKANALEYGLTVKPVGQGARLTGVGGGTSLNVATARTFGIAGHTVSNIEFAVGGSDTGYAGLLGQNILGFADIEFDLPHGVVRVMRSSGCGDATLAYWAGTRPVAVVGLAQMSQTQRHTIGTIALNGHKTRAVFDTGAAGAIVTLAAARRAGVTPDSEGVTPEGYAVGLGQSRARTWLARFDAIDLGGETVPHPKLLIADPLTLAGADMLIGIDFFLTHRVYVDNQHRRMFLTYEGGPLFGLDPKRVVDAEGAAVDITDTSAAPTDAAGFSRRGALLASKGKLPDAIADFDKAIALAPQDARYLYQRASARLASRQQGPAIADLDQAIALDPAYAEARLLRASLRLSTRDTAGAVADMRATDAALAPSADARLNLAGLFGVADEYDRAIASYDQWLHSHTEDRNRATAFNGRCWARALMNSDLDAALDDCNTALRLRPGEPAFLDSRALVRLRRGEHDKALADYDAAVTARPGNAWTLYARSLAARRTGNTAQADTDRTAALAINPDIVDRAKKYGLE